MMRGKEHSRANSIEGIIGDMLWSSKHVLSQPIQIKGPWRDKPLRREGEERNDIKKIESHRSHKMEDLWVSRDGCQAYMGHHLYLPL